MAKKTIRVCLRCGGTGRITIYIDGEARTQPCPNCQGKGSYETVGD